MRRSFSEAGQLSASASMTVLWQRGDILADHRERINYPEVRRLCDGRRKALERGNWQELQQKLAALPLGDELRSRGCEVPVVLNKSSVAIGSADELEEAELEHLRRVVELLIPWRKGPYRLFGMDIDCEWRSNRKWDRLAPHIEPLGGKRVIDIGCSSGYYMFRASCQRPDLLLGIDPSEKFFYGFELIQRFLQNPMLQYEMLSVEHMPLFPAFFDVVFCFGILYHHRSPLELLQGIKSAMAPGGQIIVESQTVPGTEPYALCPSGRYAKARNVYFVPTAVCLAAWMERCGYTDVRIVSDVPVSTDEQRSTEFMPFESLADFLDPYDRRKTVEGYPAPRRAAVTARAPG